MWRRIKKWLLAKIEALLIKEIDKLDMYEVMLVEMLREKIDSQEKAAKIIKKAKEELKKLVQKAFSWKFLSSALFSKVEDAILAEIKDLDKYEDTVANLIEAQLDKAEELAPKLVDMAQDYLKAMVKKYIKKI